MSASLSPEGLQPPAYLPVSEGIQLVHLLRPQFAQAAPDGASVVQLMAARDGEGTSSLARDLALIAAREVGLRTLLLDTEGAGRLHADWARAAHHLPFALAGTISIRPTPINIMRIGASPLHVAEPQGDVPIPASAWPGILNLLRPRFDFLLVDSPALARSFDGVLLAPNVDGTLLVIEAEATKVTQVEALRDRLLENGGKVVGTMLNKRHFHIPSSIYERT
jgi:Mrp family chromosome partitioning ATPase